MLATNTWSGSCNLDMGTWGFKSKLLNKNVNKKMQALTHLVNFEIWTWEFRKSSLLNKHGANRVKALGHLLRIMKSGPGSLRLQV